MRLRHPECRPHAQPHRAAAPAWLASSGLRLPASGGKDDVRGWLGAPTYVNIRAYGHLEKLTLFRLGELAEGAACWFCREGQEWVSLASSTLTRAIAVSMPRRTRWLS